MNLKDEWRMCVLDSGGEWDTPLQESYHSTNLYAYVKNKPISLSIWVEEVLKRYMIAGF